MTSEFSEAGRDFSRPPRVATGVGLYHHPLRMFGVQSLRVPIADRSSLRIVRTSRLLPFPVLKDPRISPHIAEFDTPCVLRVIVTPAVYWSFVRLEPAFRYQHWAGFSGRTKPFDLAATYVLVKQSGLPCHCDQPLARLAPLVPKVRGQFAEFPRVDFRRHALGFSPRGTCVSSWYGRTD